MIGFGVVLIGSGVLIGYAQYKGALKPMIDGITEPVPNRVPISSLVIGLVIFAIVADMLTDNQVAGLSAILLLGTLLVNQKS